MKVIIPALVISRSLPAKEEFSHAKDNLERSSRQSPPGSPKTMVLRAAWVILDEHPRPLDKGQFQKILRDSELGDIDSLRARGSVVTDRLNPIGPEIFNGLLGAKSPVRHRLLSLQAYWRMAQAI